MVWDRLGCAAPGAGGAAGVVRAAAAARREDGPDLHDVVGLESGAVILAVADAQCDGRVVGVDLAALRVVEAAQRNLRGCADA